MLDDNFALGFCDTVSVLFARGFVFGAVVVLLFGSYLVVEVLLGAISYGLSLSHHQNLLVLYDHGVIALPAVYFVLFVFSTFGTFLLEFFLQFG